MDLYGVICGHLGVMEESDIKKYVETGEGNGSDGEKEER